ncbi:hypothetical protein POM88_041998 [Heracleum sosnowskyi]|uniref:Protein FAR1-RELATED SEQUENCE n=1 Tax=Heracleum sosnowskyi TaxID=360622 RepID=A0AAD8MB88_9APIA|nr:hypothetical protein POM88_041998 [Heracleum sosnowskyi]
MRRPRQPNQQRTPDRRLQRTPDQTDQTEERTPEQTEDRTLDQTLHRTPEQIRQQTPLTLQHTPHQTPQQSPRQTTEPNMQNESSGVNTDLWRVGEMHGDGRLQIGVIKRVLEPSGKCSSRTKAIMYERLEPRGFTWKEVSKETKQFYFEEFKKWFVWRQPDNVIYAAWLKGAALHFTDMRSNARKDWENGKMNNRIGQDVWLSWIENWKTPEFQAKSKIKKSNRKGGVEGDVPYPGTHTSGSVSHRLLATRFGDPPATALFTYAHTRDHDNVTFVDKKSEKLHEKIVNLRAERSQPTDGSLVPQSVDENKLYYDAVGVNDNETNTFTNVADDACCEMILENEIEQLFGDGDEFWTGDSPTKPYVGQVFASIDVAFSCYKGYSSFSGFQVRRSTQKTRRGVIVSKYFVCSKAGSADNSSSRDDDDIESEASHISDTVGPVKKKTNSFWCMTAVLRNFAFNDASSNTGPVRAFNFLKSLTGSYAAVGATTVDFKNWMRDIKVFIGKHDADMILQKFKDKKETSDNTFFYEYETDSNGHLTRIFWADLEGQRSYDVFGDVVSFDATYRANK